MKEAQITYINLGLSIGSELVIKILINLWKEYSKLDEKINEVPNKNLDLYDRKQDAVDNSILLSLILELILKVLIY